MARPEGVTIYQTDTGNKVTCELEHEGLDEDGIDVWRVTSPAYRLGGVDKLQVALLPAKTSVLVMGTMPEED